MNERVPIIAPGTPRWIRTMLDVRRVTLGSLVLATTVITLFVLSIGLIFSGVLFASIGGGVILGLLLAALFVGPVLGSRQSVSAGDWRYGKRPIVGEARALLALAVTRAAEAHQVANDWSQFRPRVETLLWDAAGHAAEVCQLNAQINRQPGGDVDIDLWRQRKEHLDAVASAADEMSRVVADALSTEATVSRRERRGLRARRSRQPTDQQPEG